MNHIIVGIDTGKTAAIACLDLNGRVVSLSAKASADLKWFVDGIRNAGLPVVIASDKKRSNVTVAKLAAIFDAALYTPREDISVLKKKEIAKEWSIANMHERDALSAAISAYNKYSGKLNQVERMARENGEEEIDRIKALVIKKYSVKEAMDDKESGRFVR